MTKDNSATVPNLLSRLRDIEAECLRLSATDISSERADVKERYEERLSQLEAAHSQSWFGDHSSTYFDGFQTPPAGRSFDVEWGFIPGFSGSHNPGWRIYSRDEIRHFVFHDIGEDIFYELNNLAEDLTSKFSTVRDQTLDVLDALSTSRSSKSLSRYVSKVENEIKPFGIVEYINDRLQSAPRITRDSEEIAKGQAAPAHVQYRGAIQSLVVNRRRLKDLAAVVRNVIESSSYESEPIVPGASRKIFIGHGRSEQWRVLKDFIKERLNLEFDEFNRISAAGINTQERLSEMLSECSFAFLVLAGEDLHGDGALHARENVIHESGLFQGRLGWRKAIIVLEDGCEEFSNIVGLGQIRFAKGNIATCFEDIRRVLEREGVVER
jgi:predicted nucleotide-binding protein